jgi:alanine racemase
MGIGEAISRQAEQFSTGGSFYSSTEDFLSKFSGSMFHDEIILLKGARQFRFEQISKMLEQKAHETVLEVNLDAVVHNLNVFRSKLNPETKIMAMVKAFSYGTGSYEIANVLQFHHIDYLAVAYADGGVELRNAGITTPIMVMNPEEQSFDAMIRNNLEPEIYNFKVYDAYLDALNRISVSGPVPIHIKLETGMHRLGFEQDQLELLMDKIENSPAVFIKSVFSHLAASEDASHDEFTNIQISRFKEMSQMVAGYVDYPIMRHLLNSHGVLRFPRAKFEMVRLGIGIYGVSQYKLKELELKNVSTLKSTISQVKEVPKNETIGYGRKGRVNKKMKIAIIPVGYADGLNRKLGNGKGKLWINGNPASIVGDICMDMCMVNITGLNVEEGDEVIVFGESYPVGDFAKDLDTIPYEVLTSISQRVKRVYIHE